MKNILYYSTILVPFFTLPQLLNNSQFLLTSIPLYITSFLYHHNYQLNNIRYYDMFFFFSNASHHLIYCFYNANNFNFIFFYSFFFLFYTTGKILEKYDNIYYSDIFHSFVHIYCIFISYYITHLNSF